MTKDEIEQHISDMEYKFAMNYGMMTSEVIDIVWDDVVSQIALECNKRIVAELPTHLENSQYWKGYRDALSELLEWMEFSMDKKG